MLSKNDDGAELVATSIEDVLAGALWVSNLTDPSLCTESLHETFMKVIFSFPSDNTTKKQSTPRQRLRTVAERERERRLKEELRREERQLRGEDESERFDDEEDEEELEFDEEDDQLAQDQEFLDWIDTTHRVPNEEDAGVHRYPTEQVVGLELERLGLEDRLDTADTLPERLHEIEELEKRPLLGPKTLGGGFTYEIPLENEAYWILRQLRNAGQPLAHNTRICALASHTLAEVQDEPVLVAIAFALRKMTREHLEPAYLMLYYQSELHPLLCALLEGSDLVKAAEQSLPVASYAYSLLTGRRQRPIISDAYVGFPSRCANSIGEGDPAWPPGVIESAYAQRKPCFIELGRLLVRILELDVLCHKLEHSRQQMLIMLTDATEARVQDQRALLDSIVFESSVEVVVWHRFVQMLIGVSQRGAFHTVRALGLEDKFEEYSITGLQYQENLLTNTPINLCPSYSAQHISPHEWAEQVGSRLTPPRRGSYILSLFNSAIVDQFSKLPVLCRRVIDLFSSEGDLIVTYRGVRRPDEIYPLSSFFVENPRHYLDLLQLERQGKVDLHYVLDEALVTRLLNAKRLYQRAPTPDQGEAWYLERARAMELVGVHLLDAVIPRVRSELHAQARLQVDLGCVRRLGVLCGEGPYDWTGLRLQAYDPDTAAWEAWWNVVEALPLAGATARSPTRRRVCAAYAGAPGGTTLAFLDERGRLIGAARWGEFPLHTSRGRAAALRQRLQLTPRFLEAAPEVVVVAANGPRALGVRRGLEEFLRERVDPAVGVEIPLVWALPEVARFYGATRLVEAGANPIDPDLATTIALGRYVQDPLPVICALFDSKRTIARLFFTGTETANRGQEEELYRRLSWELSLWVASTGVWLGDCDEVAGAAAALAFVPGLGPTKSRRLRERLRDAVPSSRKELARVMEELFGSTVARNATPAIRIAAPRIHAGPARGARVDHGGPWNPLDRTLIPLEWYDLANVAAVVAMTPRAEEAGAGKGALSNGAGADALPVASCPMLALVSLLEQDPQTRREVIHKRANQQELAARIRERFPRESQRLGGERELELILEELIAGGGSFQRRPYRRLSTRELMLGITGALYLTHDEATRLLKRPLALDAEELGGEIGLSLPPSLTPRIVREGEYLTGAVVGLRGGANPGIRLITSQGWEAVIGADIADPTLFEELQRSLGALALARGREGGGSSAFPSEGGGGLPAWLRRGAPLQGRVVRCHWGRCELQLRWCPPREIAEGGDRKGDGNDPAAAAGVPSYAAILRDAASSVNSLKTVQLERDGVVFSTKISRHVLFRDLSNHGAVEYMREKELGEVLLRPSAGHRGRAVCVVKMGSSCLGNWVLREDRRPDGAFYFQLRDNVVDLRMEFGEIDEFIGNYVAPMIALVRGVRKHRRFVENVRDVPAALEDQHRTGRGFAYAFAEMGNVAKPPLYCIFTSGAGRKYRFNLHFTSSAIYMRLPVYRPSSPTRTQYVWVQCRNAEQLSQAVKNHAAQN